MALLDRLTVDLNFDARGVKAGLQKLDQGLAQARTRMGRFADGLAGGAARIQAGQQRLNAFAGAALGVGVGITAGLFKVGQAVVGFEQQLNELNAVLGNETPGEHGEAGGAGEAARRHHAEVGERCRRGADGARPGGIRRQTR